jgi:transcription elongation factor SPT5
MSAFVRWREGILLVSIQERAQLLRMSEIDAFTSNWVRIKRGLYRHDLGCIRDQESFSSRVTVAVVPRLSYNPHPTPLKSGTKRQAPHARPSQALLDVDHARQIGNVQGSRSRNGYLKFQGMYFHGGLLIRQYSVHDLITKSVTPRYDEIRLFRASPCFDLSIIRNWQIADSLATLQAGNRVEILAGELKGSLALVNDIRDNSLRAELLHLSEDTGMCHEILQLSKHHVRKAFLPGDFVQVRHGRDAGSQGYVITTSELAGQPMVTFYRHGSLIENIPPVSLFHSVQLLIP